MPAALTEALERTHVIHEAGPVLLAIRRGWESALPLERLCAGAPVAAWGPTRQHELRGRGPISVIGTSAGELVAKRIVRGGVAGGWLPPVFADRWRPLREALLGESLLRLDCPTPAVVVARAIRVAPGLHQLDVATERVLGAQDLLDALRGTPDVGPLLALTGRTLRRLHDVGLRHRDLQVKNLLVPPEGARAAQAVVLDLDRCTLGAPLTTSQRVASLSRLGRSLIKRGLVPKAPRDAPATPGWPGWNALFQAYACGDLGGAADIPALVLRRLSRTVRLHRWLWSASRMDRRR